MSNTRFIAVAISVVLLLGQYASVLHAVSHFHSDHPHGNTFLQHEGHDHTNHDYVHVVGHVDERDSNEHSDLFCLIYHLHGTAQASFSPPMDVLLQRIIVKTGAVVFANASPCTIAEYVSIRGPPVLS